MSYNADLFTPLTLGAYDLKNRIVMAPLTRCRAGADNVPQALNADYYAQRASVGLIVSEATQVAPEGVGYPATPGIHSADQVAGWKRVTEAVHDRDGLIFLQLWHVGRISHPSFQPNGALPVAPSAIRPEGEVSTLDGRQPFVTPRALETVEIAGVVAQYRQAAENAREAGFDGVEVQAANGYLLDQFLRDGSNWRDDRYGGSIENRARLLMEVLETVTQVWGGDKVGLRLSPGNAFNSMVDSAPDATFGYVVDAINRFGLAYLHVVEFGAGEVFDAHLLRAAFHGPYMANGGYDHDNAATAIASGAADAIAFGQLIIANPDLAARFESGADLNDPDPATFYGGDAAGYTDYPFLDNHTQKEATL